MNPLRQAVPEADADAALRVSFAADCDQAAAVEQAAAILTREGVVVLDDLVDPAVLEACRAEIVARYPDYAEPNRERYLGSYPGRHTAPLVIDGVLADPAVFAPKPIRAIGARLLGPDAILESLGLLVSVPGAPDQAQHYDGLLFEETTLDRLLPPAALSISLPLVPLTKLSGTTSFWLRSHRKPIAESPADFAPLLPVGSAIVWDFRTVHSGGGNHSDDPRPILFSVHSRDWWQEPTRPWATRYRKLQVARAVQQQFNKRMQAFTVRADLVD